MSRARKTTANFKAPPGYQIEWVDPASLQAYLRNARTHSAEQIEQLGRSIKQFGWTRPIITRGNVIAAGHGAWRAAVEILKLPAVPRINRADMTEKQFRAYVIADNRLGELSTWDKDMLRDELGALKSLDVDLALLGFDESALNTFMGPIDTEGAEETPPPPKNPTSRTGDTWACGNHRIVCGDATKPETVGALHGSARSVLMITDPPYGVDYGNIRDSIRRSGRTSKKYDDIANDELSGEKLQEFLEATIKAALPMLSDAPAFYLWHPMLTQGTFFAAAAAAADILIHRQIIWVKPSLILGRGDYHWRHELCFYGWIRGKRCKWYGNRSQTTVWEISRENDGVHPTQKPIDCMRLPIEHNSKAGQAVYDPFLGSGTTLMAAEISGRRCMGIDLDPTYVDVAVMRWEKFTGLKATLVGTKKTFEDVRAERLKGKKKKGTR